MTAFLSQTLFPALLNMSLTAGIVILCVIAARLALKRAPKVFSYALWAVVLFRLLCPVSLSSGISLLGALDAPARQASPVVSTVTYVQPQQKTEAAQPQTAESAGPASDPVVPAEPDRQTAPTVDWAAAAAWVWLAGVLGMAGYSIFALLRLRCRLVGSLRLRDNIYLADHISTPFVLGLVWPKIYLPSTLTEGEMGYIIRHERYHIRHGDHVVKVLAFAGLCLHWFNPLVWAAFILAGKDMEMRCDEAVVRQLGEEVKADYSASLLALATGRLTIAGTPLAFGEGDPKGRIRNLLRWKRPRMWLSLVAGVACVAVIAACAANPAGPSSQPPAGGGGRYQSMEDFAQQTMDNAKEVTYYSYANQEATAQVTSTKLAWLDKQGELEGLAPEGTLEAWTFNYLVQIDAPAEDIALVGGMYEEDGWFDLEGQGGHNIVSLRYPDGTYDILYNQIVNDDIEFLGHHNSYEEAIYDWYVTDQGLDLPLHVKDWNVLMLGPDGEQEINVPVRRYDGDGWYLYVPVMAWTQWSADPVHSVWVSQYNTGSAITVDYTKTNLADYLAGDTGGMTPAGDSGRVFEAQGDGWNYRYYYVEGTEGCWRITIQWQDDAITDYPYIAIEPQVMALMAESFTPDSRITLSGQGLAMESVLKNASGLTSRLVWVDGNQETELARTGAETEAMGAAAARLVPIKDPESYMDADGGLCLYLNGPGDSHISVYAIQSQPYTVLLRYVGDTVNESAIVEDPQLYLYLTAAGEDTNVVLCDLDDDGFQEALVWPADEERKLIIYDYYEDGLHKIDVAWELGADFADSTTLIGNIQREYSDLVLARVDGEEGVYQYKDGTLTYVCTLEEALLKT
ncbi:M56 family metallopeptidase [uncultured Flavonifractor sp.]|uniref:M56 family metallopeptidase n=1 Tax=uncultured Flavonifractor sp. TaxID=1193534 RepID=UPI00266FEA79|nr:M56 family metallopeptidase [uncultured Flavonifractor sp.]